MTFVLHADARTYLILRDGVELLRYTCDGFDYHPHAHPVRTPDGHCLTATRSGDHPWHEGMFFSWKYINGCNVWDRDFSGSDWGRPVHGSSAPCHDRDLGPGLTAGLRQHLRWCRSDGQPLLHDERTLIVGRIDQADAYSIDWTVRTTPLEDEVVLERHVAWGGYAGLMVRLVRNVAPEISNSAGRTGITEDVTDTAAWMDYRFWLDGLPSRTHFEHWAGLTVMSHPENPRHPSPFRGYFAKNIHGLHVPFLRDEPLVLRRGEILDLAYRVMIYRGTPTRRRLDDWYRRYELIRPFSAGS